MDKLPTDHTSCCTLGEKEDRNCFVVADCIANIVTVDYYIILPMHRTNLDILDFERSDMLVGSGYSSKIVMVLRRGDCFGSPPRTGSVKAKLVDSTDYSGDHS